MNGRRIGMLMVGVLLVGSVVGQETPEKYGPKPAREKDVRAKDAANLAASKDKPDLLALPGLLADRKARTVEVAVESTGLRADDVAEFLLVGHESSHGYEALLWSYAKPSDVHAALQFIGLKPAPPRHPAMPRIVRGGDRVILAVRDVDGKTFPIEQLIVDKQTCKTLPEEGFVFSGSIRTIPSSTGETRYVADVDELRSVASLYNEPTAVLDVPRSASQGDVYGNQVVNPDFAATGGVLRTVVMTPAPSDGKPPPRNLQLSVSTGQGTNGLACRLADKEKVLSEGSDMMAVLERLTALQKAGEVPNIELSLGATLPLRDVVKVCTLCAVTESFGIAIMMPPPPGQLYHMAFVPDKSWQEPKGRPCQPWELHMIRRDGKVLAQMVWNEAIWPKDGTDPTFKRHNYPVSDSKSIQARLTADAQERLTAGKTALPAVLLVFADAGLTYGELSAFIQPVLGTHGTVYVFLYRGT